MPEKTGAHLWHNYMYLNDISGINPAGIFRQAVNKTVMYKMPVIYDR
jgi:hypothetical protein